MLRIDQMNKLFTFIFLFSSVFAYSQEYNKVDANGKKQGDYRKFYASAKDKIFYTGQFKDDKPYGTFTYYYKNGEVKSYMNYGNKGIVRAEVFTENGKLMAQGNYIDKQKDSTWVYLNENGTPKSFENWTKGKKTGLEVIFYNNADTAEVMLWKDEKLNGPWRQYFANGKLKLKTIMVDDQYDGDTFFYHDNGKLNIKGKYVSGYRNGSWYHYNRDGSIQMQVLYRGGEVVKEKRENGVFFEYFQPEIPESEITYKNGMKNGPFIIYHEGAERVKVDEVDKLTGEVIPKEIVKGIQPKMKGMYRNDQLHGTITYFNRAGKVIKTENFDNGTLVKN